MPHRTTLLLSDSVQKAELGRAGVNAGAQTEEDDIRPLPGQGGTPVTEENLRLRQELLVVRDELIGQEARLGEALGRIELLEADLARYRDAVAEAERLLGTRTGRLLRAWHHLRALLRG